MSRVGRFLLSGVLALLGGLFLGIGRVSATVCYVNCDPPRLPPLGDICEVIGACPPEWRCKPNYNRCCAVCSPPPECVPSCVGRCGGQLNSCGTGPCNDPCPPTPRPGTPPPTQPPQGACAYWCATAGQCAASGGTVVAGTCSGSDVCCRVGPNQPPQEHYCCGPTCPGNNGNCCGHPWFGNCSTDAQWQNGFGRCRDHTNSAMECCGLTVNSLPPPTGLRVRCLSSTSAELAWDPINCGREFAVRVDDGLPGNNVTAPGVSNDCSPHDVCVNRYQSNSMVINFPAGRAASWWLHTRWRNRVSEGLTPERVETNWLP